MPDGPSSSGTDAHSATRAATSGSSTVMRARSGLPPLLSATTAAVSGGTPESVSQRTRTSRGTGGNSISTDRLATVTSSGITSSVSRMKTVSPGGSSRVFNRAGARRAARCTSSRTITWRAACSGRRCASETTWRISAMEMDAPLRRMTCRSGSVPASAARQVAQAPHPPSGHSSAAANPWAAARPPLPAGPRKR